MLLPYLVQFQDFSGAQRRVSFYEYPHFSVHKPNLGVKRSFRTSHLFSCVQVTM